MNYINSDRLLFVCASPAAAGYRLGRIISCLDNVYWYQSIRNGKYPWSVNIKELPPNHIGVVGRDISKYHFDRRTKKNMIPLVGERVDRFWDDNDTDSYYNNVWVNLMTVAGADDIISQGKYILWIVHDAPSILLNRFPNCKIINLLDDNINDVAARYLTTTSLYPINIKNPHIKPSYNSKFSQLLMSLEQFNQNPTHADFWAWTNHNVLKYTDSFKTEYHMQIIRELSELNRLKEVTHDRCLNLSWKTFNVDDIINFCKASSIDNNYKSLL
jgi:hypothetical protein